MPDYIPVSPQDHAEEAWQAVRGYAFAAGQTLVPLAFDELTRASGHLVLGFTKPADHYQLVALLGPGFNAYVHPADGRWLGSYVPSKLRGAPFELGFAPDNPEQPLLCIDPAALVAVNTPGAYRLFEADGQLSAKSAEVLDFLHQRLKGGLAVERVMAELTAIPDLIEPWPLRLPGSQGVQDLTGFYRINEAALKALSPEQLHQLNRHQALGLAYAQLIATTHLHELAQRCAALGRLKQQQAAAEPSLDQLFFEQEEDLFKF
ncbi:MULTISPECIES: SapC family protein [Thiorhodovibrio]|uniref:SapC family protein n=1 Tax=Thiorhodovibrio TaxID=61593 RepID=UPI001913A053|nr:MULTISPECIES: SapC family protein [Thiorhodovibrio]MBK5968819.1 hypothetical protein [Thiorhodovibrio winogradskyi]WPL11902.1 SapC [Thiorhodovibrio litoralis]